jgi:hypothetical protein
MKQSSDLRKQTKKLARGSSREENGQLYTENQELIKRAKDRWYVPDPNRASDLEKLRERALLREFEEYKNSKQSRIRPVRLEAVRVGFKKAWQERDYATIIAVARKIPESALQEDPKLLMWYDQALTRLGRRVIQLRLKEVIIIKNFRGYREETRIQIHSDLTAFIGRK